MGHNYTTIQVLKFLYNELPALEHLETEYAIENDPEWDKVYQTLKAGMSALPKIEFFPRQGIVRSLVNYSRMAS